jgi:hypothetical protein
MINPDDVFQPCEDVISRKMIDEVVIVNLKSETIYTLNETGAKFWELMEEGKRIDQIIVEIQNEYNITEEILQNELEFIVSQLLERGLIQHAK